MIIIVTVCVQFNKKAQTPFNFSGVRIAVYDRLRKKLDVSDNHSGLPLWEAAICGVVAGGLAQWYNHSCDSHRNQFK